MGFAAGFSVGYKAVSDAMEAKEKREQEEKKRLLEQKQKIEKIKEDNLSSLSSSIEKRQEQLQNIATSKMSPEDKVKATNAWNNQTAAEISRFMENVANTGDQDALAAANSYVSSLNLENQGLVEDASGNKYYAPEQLANDFNENRDMYDIKSDGTVFKQEFTNDPNKPENINIGKLQRVKADEADKEKFATTDLTKAYKQHLQLNNLEESDLSLSKFKNTIYSPKESTSASGSGTGSGLSKGGQWVTHPDYENPVYRSNTEIANDPRFQPAEKKDTVSVGDIKVKQYDSYRDTMIKAGKQPLEYDGWEQESKQKAFSKVIVETKKFSDAIKNDSTNYDSDKALELEAKMYGTKAFTTKLSEKKDELERGAILEKGLNELNTRFTEAVNSGEYKSGLLQTTKKKIAEYTGTESVWLDFTKLEPEEMATSLGLESSMGDTVARYVKLISGAAATDAERATLMNIMFGSEYKSQEVRLNKFNQFISDRKRDNRNLALSIQDRLPYTAGKYLYEKEKEDIPTETDMKPIGKAGDYDVYEDDKGQYIVVNGKKRYKKDR